MAFVRNFRGSIVAIVVALAAVALTADGGPDHQISSPEYGTSGGNINDISRLFCCSGTLGSLVSDGQFLYILSNNHVLARSDQAAAGEDVSQPGLVDNACQAEDIVADLAAYPRLGSNVDAAVATLRSSTMSTAGSIMDIGPPSPTTLNPSVGLAVAKSGRTTGLTRGTIGAINVDLSVQYQVQCGFGKKFVVDYTDQFAVNSSSFSAGGDSGSLIVSDDSNHNPVGLLYAGSSSTTFANPINDVLTQVSQAVGRTVSFTLSGQPGGGSGGGGGGGGGGRGRGRGGAAATNSSTTPGPPSVFNLTDAEVARGRRAKENHGKQLRSNPSVLGVGVGEDPAAPGQAAVIVYLLRGSSRANIARDLDGVSTVIVETDPIVAYGWNEPLGGGGACKVR
jgi:hypothetical protein